MATARLVGKRKDFSDVKRKARLRKDLDRARVEARQIKKAGGSARAEVIRGKVVVVTVKEAPKVAVLQTKKGKPIRELTQFDVQRIRNIERQRQLQAQQIQKQQTQAKKKVQLRFTDTGAPRTTKVLEAISKARSDVTVPIPQRKLQGVVAEEFLELRRNADAETFIRLKKFGVSNKTALSEAKKAFKKKEAAIKKVEAVNQKLEGYRQNYERSVGSAINGLKKVARPDSVIGRIREGSFSDKVLKKTVTKITSFLNPIIVGTEIGGFAANFKTLREAGIINPSKFVDKTFTGAGRGIKFVLTNDPRTTFNTVSDRTVDFAVKTVESAKKNLNPNTPEGLSNLLTVAFFVRPDKILKGVGKRTIANIKKVAANPKVRRVTKGVVLSPLGVIGAAGRGGAIPKGVKIGKGVKAKGKPLTKAAKRKGQTPKVLTKTQKKAARKELAREQSFQNVAQRQRDIDFSAPVKSFTVGKGKTIVVKRGKTVVGTVKVQPTPKTTKLSSSQISSSAKRIEKAVSSGGKSFSSGNLKLVTKQQRQTFRKEATNALKKSGASQKTKTVIKKNIDRRVPRTADKVTTDLSPQALYPQLIEVNQQGKGGFRRGVKEKLLQKLEAQKKVLDLQRNKEVVKTNLLINNAVKKRYSDVKDRNLAKSLIYNEVFRPRFNVEIATRLVNKGFASKLDNSLRALSLLNFKFDVTSDVIKIVKRTPVIKPKQDIVSKPTTRIVKKVVSKPPKKTFPKSKGKPRAKPKKPLKAKEKAKKRLLVQRVLKSPRVPTPKIRRALKLPKRLFLPRLKKNKRIRKTIDVVRATIPSQFRPTLEAIYFEILDTEKPEKITGLEIRAIIVKLTKKKMRNKKSGQGKKRKTRTKTTVRQKKR